MKRSTQLLGAAIMAVAIAGSAIAASQSQRLATTPKHQDRLEAMKEFADQTVKLVPQAQAISPMKAQSRADEEAEVILYEDFSLMTAGSVEEPDGTMLPEDYWETANEFLPDGYTLTSGWWGLGIYQAGGTCFLGYPGIGGSISTPYLNLNGEIRVSFRIKAGPNVSKSANVIVSLLKGDQFYPDFISSDMTYELVTITPEEDWVDYSFTYTIDYTGDDAFLQINGMTYDNGKFIDDIKIERLGNPLSTPVAYQPTDYTGDSFVANWNEQKATNDYELTVYNYTVPEGDDIAYSANFANENTSAIAYTDGNTIAEIPGTTGDYALAAFQGESIIFDGCDARIKGLKLKAFGLGLDEKTEVAYVALAGYRDGAWQACGGAYLYGYAEKPDDELDLFANSMWLISNYFEKVRITIERIFYTDVVYIDDVEMTTGPQFEYDYELQDQPVTGTQYAVTGLNPEKDYFYYVCATDGTTSLRSNTVKAYQLVAPVCLEATDLDERGGFTANWQPVAKAEAYQAQAFSVVTLTADDEAYPLLEETFANAAPEGYTMGSAYSFDNEYDYVSLDDYADNAGWTGINTAMAENMIGCDYDDYYTSILESPTFDASNNGGVYTVEFDCYCELAGEILIIQNAMIDYTRVQLAAEKRHYSVTFENGSNTSFVCFYTSYGYPFLIGNVKVTQSLTAGTEIATMLAQSPWIEETEYYFPELKCEDGKKLVFDVTAKYTRESTTYYSPTSDPMIVSDLTTGLRRIADDSLMGISVDGRTIMAADTAIEVYDVAGRKVAAGFGTATVKAAGMYIVVAGDMTRKVAIR